MIDDTPSSDLSEARAKIDAACKVLQDALGSRDHDALREAIARLERIAAEVERIEGDLRMSVAVQDALG